MKSKNILARGILLVRAFIYLAKYSFYRKTLEFKKLVSKRDFNKKFKTNIGPSTVIKYINIMSKFMYINSCLTKSLAAREILFKSGFQPVVTIGVKKNSENFESHAWIRIGDFHSEPLSKRRAYTIIEELI